MRAQVDVCLSFSRNSYSAICLSISDSGDPSESPKVVRQGYAKRSPSDGQELLEITKWLSVWLSRSRSATQLYPRLRCSLLTCTDFKPHKEQSIDCLRRCKRSKISFEDHNMRLTCGNVELRGLEPLASCMPSMAGPSGMVRDGQIRADQNRAAVWQQPESTGVRWARSHLVSHWPREGA